MGAYQILGHADESNDMPYTILGHADEDEESLPELPQFNMPEKTGLSGVLSDAASLPGKLLNFGMGLPGQVDQSIEQVRTNPKRGLLNMLVGAGEGAKQAINLPYNVNQYLGKKNLLPEMSKKYGWLIPHIPEDTGVQKSLIGKAQPGDQLLQMLPQLIMGKPAARMAAAELPITKGFASLHLKDARKMAKEAGVNSLNVNPAVIDDAEKFLRESKFIKNEPAINDLITKAKAGDYDALFTLQSDIEKASRKLLQSSVGSERNYGLTAGYGTRQDLLNEFKNSLRNKGYKDIANKMERGQAKYRQYHAIDKNIYNLLRKHQIPLGIAGLLGFGANKFKKSYCDNED